MSQLGRSQQVLDPIFASFDIISESTLIEDHSRAKVLPLCEEAEFNMMVERDLLSRLMLTPFLVEDQVLEGNVLWGPHLLTAISFLARRVIENVQVIRRASG